MHSTLGPDESRACAFRDISENGRVTNGPRRGSEGDTSVAGAARKGLWASAAAEESQPVCVAETEIATPEPAADNATQAAASEAVDVRVVPASVAEIASSAAPESFLASSVQLTVYSARHPIEHHRGVHEAT